MLHDCREIYGERDPKVPPISGPRLALGAPLVEAEAALGQQVAGR
jgi:hypothetical protein